MANQEHLDILNQGVEAWNQWREEHPDIQPDLNEADLGEMDLIGTNFSRAQLHGATLFETELSMSNLREADLGVADFRGAELNGSNFSGSDLGGADLTRANLRATNLNKTLLVGANLKDVYLEAADLSEAKMGDTILIGVDLSQTKGLDSVKHIGPSAIGIDTIYRSEGHIPENFLRKAGVPDAFMDYMHSLVVKPIDYYTCFLSYSSHDEPFARRLYADLQNNSVRCWYAPEDMKIGDEIRTSIDESIRVYDKLLLVLSEHSIASTWVKNEVETAFEKEGRQGTRVLFPIAVDDAIKHTSQAWAATIRRRKHIGDFTKWEQQDDYQQALERLLRDLKAK